MKMRIIKDDPRESVCRTWPTLKVRRTTTTTSTTALWRTLVVLSCLVCLVQSTHGYFYKENPVSDNDKQCFCELKGSIDDCSCNMDTVDHFNNVKIYPRIQSLLRNNYFRFYKTHLKQKCPFWADDSHCAMKFCSVQSCEESDVPEGIKGAAATESGYYKYSKGAQRESDPLIDSPFATHGCSPSVHQDELSQELGLLNMSISSQDTLGFQLWADYDQSLDNFCILDDHQPGADYVDLHLNPERYTGYKGESAHRIWRSIYLENCFGAKNEKTYMPYIPYRDMSSVNGICTEHRVFYRLVSGLHTSINIHLSANYLLSEKSDFLSKTGVWGPNLDEFVARFSPSTTDDEGQYWLRNLYFLYIVELRALAKASNYLRNEGYFTGDDEQDAEVKMAIRDLLNVIESFPSHFQEKVLFADSLDGDKMKAEFRERFRNISKIMDCVGCDKCRLWGKLQVQGLGTALKILFSGKFDNEDVATVKTEEQVRSEEKDWKLKRTEIVSLFNAFGRLSNSIYELENFRRMLR